jgi:ribonuclease P/MRP protein subunit POP5
MAVKIKPSKRQKKRYIVFQIVSEDKFGFEEAKKAIVNACFKYLGEFTCEKAKPYIIQNVYIGDKNRGILRVGHKYVEDIKKAFSMIKKINEKNVMVRPLGISGILKKAKNKFLLKN